MTFFGVSIFLMENLAVYLCWYDLLGLSNRRRWTARVKRVFGPVADETFDVWWEELMPLFDAPPHFTVAEVTDAAQFESFMQYGREEGMMVFLNLREPKEELLAEVRRLLKARHAGKRGRPEYDDYATIRMVRKPDEESIRKAIDVYKAVKANGGERPVWEIGQEFAVNSKQLMPYKAGTEREARRRRLLTISVHNVVKRAEVLIRGVERGVFPAASDSTQCKWKALR
jgi:hypothetical protein